MKSCDVTKCISDKTVAEIHGVKVFHVRELIGNNIKRFTVGVDYIDMKKRIGTDDTSLRGKDVRKRRGLRGKHVGTALIVGLCEAVHHPGLTHLHIISTWLCEAD